MLYLALSILLPSEVSVPDEINLSSIATYRLTTKYSLFNAARSAYHH